MNNKYEKHLPANNNNNIKFNLKLINKYEHLFLANFQIVHTYIIMSVCVNSELRSQKNR